MINRIADGGKGENLPIKYRNCLYRAAESLYIRIHTRRKALCSFGFGSCGWFSNGSEKQRRPALKTKGKTMPLYETVFIARQDVSAKQVEDYAKAFAKIVNDNDGETKKTESWGLRNLAYKIKKNKKGHYTLMHFDASPAAIAEMERNIRLNEDVLRHMTVSVDKLPEGPSAILKQSDDDRSFGEGAGRTTLLKLFGALGGSDQYDDLIREFRRKLSAALN